MRVAITATGATLAADVDPRFGRCAYFLIVDVDDLSFEAVENPNVALGGGAGIQSAQLVADKGAEVVLTGNCGPNAYQTLEAAGVGVVLVPPGPVKTAIEQFRRGEAGPASQPNVASHFGVGAEAPPGPAPGARASPAAFGGGMGGGGRGMGRGMGGGGRGMGRGMGAAMPPPVPAAPPAAPGGADELTMLQQQAEASVRQVEQVKERINQLTAQKDPAVAIVDPGKCTGCGLCVDACPVEAIQVVGETAVIDADACTACGACVEQCPEQAISLPG